MSNLLTAAGHQEFVDENITLIDTIREQIDMLSGSVGSVALNLAYTYNQNECSVTPLLPDNACQNPYYSTAVHAIQQVTQTAHRLYVNDIHEGLRRHYYTPEDVVHLRAPQRRIVPTQADWQRNELSISQNARGSFASIKLFGTAGVTLASAHTTHLDDGQITSSFNLLQIHGEPAYLHFDMQPASASKLLAETVRLLGQQRGIPYYSMARRTKTETDLAMLGVALDELASDYICSSLAHEIDVLIKELYRCGGQSVRAYNMKKLVGNEDGFPMYDELSDLTKSLIAIVRSRAA
ncbi:MAG: hypothetical protein WBP26_02095 [Candidatus Saccharimonadales bacterium]